MNTRYPTYNVMAGKWFDNGQAITLQEGDVVSNWVNTEYAFTLLPDGLYWEKIQTTRPGAVTYYRACRMGNLATFLNGESGSISNGAVNLLPFLALIVFLVALVIAARIPVDLMFVPGLLGF